MAGEIVEGTLGNKIGKGPAAVVAALVGDQAGEFTEKQVAEVLQSAVDDLKEIGLEEVRSNQDLD